MIGLVAGIVWRYDMKIVNKKKWEIPRVGEFDNLAKQPTVWIEYSMRKTCT